MLKTKLKFFNLPSKYDNDIIIISVVIRMILFFVLYLPTIFFFSNSTDIFRLLTIYGIFNVLNMLIVYFFRNNLNSVLNNSLQIVLMLLEIVMESLIVYTSGGIVSNFNILYIYTIISSAIFFNISGAIIVTFIIAAAYALIFYLQSKSPNINFLLNSPQILKIYYFNIISFFSIAVLTGILSKKIKIATHLLDEKNKMATIGEMSSKLIHEIKNPLSAILGSAEMLQNSKFLSKKRLYGLIYKEAKRIDYLMHDFFSVLKKKEPSISTFNITKLLNDIVFLYGEEFYSKNGINYIYNGPQKIIEIESDSNMIEQIFVNLYRNALQASDNNDNVENGEVIVDFVDNKNYIIVKFIDNGGGIPNDIFDTIFMPFISTKLRGTGLGLAVVKNLCDILNIEINYKNIVKNDNAGAEFLVKINKFFYKEE